ncbi:MAG: DNA-directed RNA polymerase subunit omega [Acutalibacteraceae bacterium]|nr:DNA-directed RNA polymerase subunit omega [Acutalibacteraceae bacterium]
MSEAKKTEMKFNPDLSSVLQNRTSRYSLVIATAKRARAISDKAIEDGESIIEKPVSLALNEFLNGDYVLVEPEEIRNI